MTCHSEIAREWKGSLHRVAYEDGSFARALAHEDTAFCRGCHAPEADASKAPSAELAAIGVGCITCHVPKGSAASKEVLASPKETSTKSPHPVTRTAAFATSAACASCHEFDFPDGNARTRPEPMQLTVKEHEKLGEKNAGATCGTCHMPTVTDGSRSHRSHAFVASRSPEMLKRAVRVSARRADDTTALEIVFTRGDVGHAFPTGDLFRRLVVSARIEGDSDKAKQVRYLARHFAQRQQLPGVFVRVVARDDRPFADGENEKVVKLALGERAKGKRAVYRVVFQRVQEVAPMNEDRAIVDGEIEIASGVVE